MKIYNKKEFASGIFTLSLGVLNLGLGIASDASGALLTAALFVMGISEIVKSLSQRLSREDRLLRMDERNLLIELKSKSRSFQLTQLLSFGLMLAALVMGKVSGDERFVAMGVGLAFAFSISMLAEVFTYMYYEMRN